MPSVDELLNVAEVIATELTETNDVIEIDADTRTMMIPETERVFGVMSDEKGERKYFRCKRFVGNGIDLSKLSLRVIFQNASGLDTGKDKYIVTDLATDGEDYITFSWELSRKVTAYKGIISFIVCATKTNTDGTITNEWNTTIANGLVLDGLEVDGTQEQEEVAKDYYNQLEAELLKVANEQINKVQEVVKTIPSDYTQMQKDVRNLKEEFIDGRTDVDGNIHDKIGDAMRGQARKLRENLVVRQKEQPTDPNNNVWISDEDDEVEVPDMGEFNSLKEDLANFYSENLFDPINKKGTIDGITYDFKNGVLSVSGTKTGRIKLQTIKGNIGDKFSLTCLTNEKPPLYIMNGSAIVLTYPQASYTSTFELPAETVSLEFYVSGTFNYTFTLMLIKNEFPKFPTFKTIEGDNLKSFCDASYEAIGDSLTYGFTGKWSETGEQIRINTPYVDEVKNILGFKRAINKGETGTTIANDTEKMGTYHPISSDSRLASYEYSRVISVMGGTNDYVKSTKLGSVTDSLMSNTFHAGWKRIFENLNSRYNGYGYFIFVIIPPVTEKLYVKNSENATFYDYIQATIEECRLYGVPVLDMSIMGSLSSVNKNIYTSDGIHFNQKYTTQIFAPMVAEFIKQWCHI